MKNILFSLIFVLNTCPLWPQQQSDVLQQMEHRTHYDPIMQQHENPDQDQMIDGEMDFLFKNMQNTETVIRVDSAFYSTKNNDYKQLCMYDPNGNMLNNHIRKWDKDTWEDYRLYTYAYDIYNNVLIYLKREAITSGWRNREVIFYSYDDNGYLLNELIQRIGHKDKQYTYTYDNKGNMLTELCKVFENDSWVSFSSKMYTYDSIGNRLTCVMSDRGSNFLVPASLNTYTYDANGNIIIDLSQYWGYCVWENSMLTTYTYDSSGNELTYLRQTWNDSIWVNSILETYTYDTIGNKLTYLYEQFANDTCYRKYLSTYGYDANGNKISYLYQQWKNNKWMNLQLIAYIYDNYGNLQTYLHQYYGNGTWVNNKKEEYIFMEGQIIATAYEWDGNNWIQPNTATLSINMGGEIMFTYSAISLELYYSDISGIEDPQTNSENSPILCYPNPVTDQINIKIDPAWQAKNYQLELFSQTGQKVKSFKISSNIGSSIAPIKVDNVPPGLYLLRIEAGKQIFSQKIIISK